MFFTAQLSDKLYECDDGAGVIALYESININIMGMRRKKFIEINWIEMKLEVNFEWILSHPL